MRGGENRLVWTPGRFGGRSGRRESVGIGLLSWCAPGKEVGAPRERGSGLVAGLVDDVVEFVVVEGAAEALAGAADLVD